MELAAAWVGAALAPPGVYPEGGVHALELSEAGAAYEASNEAAAVMALWPPMMASTCSGLEEAGT